MFLCQTYLWDYGRVNEKPRPRLKDWEVLIVNELLDCNASVDIVQLLGVEENTRNKANPILTLDILIWTDDKNTSIKLSFVTQYRD